MNLEDRLRNLLLAYELPMTVHANIDDAADELEAMRKDAERYRWLRDAAAAFVVRPFADKPGAEWDAAIDAAMKDKP